MRRAITSEVPPGANGTTIFIGWLGQLAARAADHGLEAKPANAAC
jgi:hypothetical protein